MAIQKQDRELLLDSSGLLKEREVEKTVPKEVEEEIEIDGPGGKKVKRKITNRVEEVIKEKVKEGSLVLDDSLVSGNHALVLPSNKNVRLLNDVGGEDLWHVDVVDTKKIKGKKKEALEKLKALVEMECHPNGSPVKEGETGKPIGNTAHVCRVSDRIAVLLAELQ